MSEKNKKRSIQVILLLFFLILSSLYSLFSVFFYYWTSSDLINAFLTFPYYSLPIIALVLLFLGKSYSLTFTKVIVYVETVLALINTLSGGYVYLILGLPYIILSVILLLSKSIKDYYEKEEDEKEGLFWLVMCLLFSLLVPIYGLIFSIIGLKRKYDKRFIFVIALLLSISSIAYSFLNPSIVVDYETNCSNYCYALPSEYYAVEVDNSTGEDVYTCYCLSPNSTILSSVQLPIG